MTVSRTASGYRLDFALGVSFTIIDRRVAWRADVDVAPATVRHLLLDQVLPLAISGAAALVLHGSGVLVHGYGVAFVGPSGRGKSTLAAACASRGFPMLSDDCVRLDAPGDGWQMHVSYPGLRLWSDTLAMFGHGVPGEIVAPYTEKRRLLTTFSPRPLVPLRRIYLLDSLPGATPRLRRASVDGAVDLIRCTFRLDPHVHAASRAHFAAVTALVETGAVWHLTVPRDFTQLDSVVRMIADEVDTANLLAAPA